MHFDTILRTVLTVLLLCGVAAFGFAGCARGKEKICTLSFSSFDGGGASYSVSIEDESILSYTSKKQYAKANHAALDGAGYDVIFTFKGLKSGRTVVTVTGESPLMPTEVSTYVAVVDDALRVTLTQQGETVTRRDPMLPMPTLIFHTEQTTAYPSIADTDAANEMVELLSREPAELTLAKTEDGFSGKLPWTLPQAGETLTAKPGDMVLSGENQLVLCTEEQSGAFTLLASLNEATLEELLPALNSAPTVSLWVEWSE